MNRTTRTVVVICIATVLAALGTLGVYGAVQRMPVKEVEIAHAMVAVAAEPLPTGTRLTAEHVRMVPWPASSVLPGSFLTTDAVVDRGLIASVVENEPLLESKLAPVESGAGLAAMIPQGMRAMAVRVDDGSGVAGFVTPGTRVDVLVTFRGGGTDAPEPRARIVLTNVLVLTSGTRLDQQTAPEAVAAGAATVVTLALTPDEAASIALAATEGRIALALRNPLDPTLTGNTGIGLAELIRGAPKVEPVQKPAPRPAVRRTPPPPPQPEPEPEPEPITVETIRASKKTTEVVE